MKFFARLMVPLLVAVFTMIVGCAPNIFADTAPKCPLGQTANGDSCQDYSDVPDMPAFVAKIMSYIGDFAKANNIKAPSQKIVHVGMPDDYQPSVCTGAPGGAMFDACYADGQLYMGSVMMYQLYESNGALAPITIIAHEIGHYWQDVAGIAHDDASPGDPMTVRLEKQADCVSGAFIAWLGTKQRITLAMLTTLLGMIWEHGSNPYAEPYKIHGTPPERTESFTTGYDSGLSACNAIGNGPITK